MIYKLKKSLCVILAFIILVMPIFSDLILFSSEVYATTETEDVVNDDEIVNETEENIKTDDVNSDITHIVMPIEISDFSVGEKVAILINVNNEIKIVPTSYSDIQKLCDEGTTVYYGVITENGIEIDVDEKADKIIFEFANKTKEELNKIVQIISKEEVEKTNDNKIIMVPDSEDNGIMPASNLGSITGLNSSAKFGVVDGSYARFGHEMHYMTTGGVTSLVYCMEYSKRSPTGKEYYYGSDYTTRVDENLKSLSLLIYFGHVLKYGTGVPTSDEAWKTAIASQQMCWTVASSEFDTKYPISGIWKSSWLTKNSWEAWRQDAIDRCCEYYGCSYSDDEGFTNWSTIKTWNDVKVNVGETYNLENSWFEKFGDFSVEKDGVTFSHTNKSNTLSIKANKVTSVNFDSSESNIYALTPDGQNYDEGNTNIYIAFISSSVQDMFYTNFIYPMYFKVNVSATGGKILLKKVSESGTGLQGATFSVIAGEDITSSSASYHKGDEVGTITTGADGIGSIENLPLGKYQVVEKSVPTGYILDTTPHEVTLTEETSEIDIGEISNVEPTGELQFKKVNDNGDGLAGVEFELFADENITNVDGSITYYTKDQKIRSIITDEDGIGRIDNLKLGRYYLKEFATPNGYLANDKKYTFSIDFVDANTETILVDLGEIINYEPTGKITVTKTNKNGDKVPNAKFIVTAAEDIKNKLGTVTYFHAGDEVGTIENTTDGTGSLENLHLGKYLVTENYSPTGYLLNTESKEVELRYADENTAVVFDSTTIANDEPTGVIDVKKADVLTGNEIRPDGTYHHGDATFSGAVYTLYASKAITNYAKTVTYYNQDDEIAQFTFDATGTPTVKILNNADGVSLTISGSKLKGLPMGEYYLRETSLPKSGYLPDTTTYNFSVDYIDQYTADIDVSQTVKEQVERAKFELIKVSTDMNQVAPVVDKAQFTAILEKYVKYYGSFDEAYEHIDEFAEDEWCTFETDLDGHGISDFLAYGKYVVSETYVPDSDINRVEEFTVTIDENSDGVIKEVIANDSPFTAYIKMVKKDKKTGKVVTYSNATFELYKYDKATREWNLVQCKVGSKYYREWTTDENGICETETPLDAGTYRLVEKVIPQGFNELEDNLIFYVNSMNESVEYDLNWDAWITVEAENEQPTGKLVVDKSVILKEDVDKSLIDTSDLSSIKFRLKANEDIIDYADGSVIYKKGETIGEYNVDAEGHLEISELPMGSYILQEISFLDGTVLNSEVYEVTFEQTDTKTKEYVVEKDIENQTTLVELSKADITGENEVVGAKLQVIDEEGNIVDEWISKKEPHTIEGLIVDHEYTLHEEIAAEGYVKAKDVKFTVENSADMQKVQMKDEQVSVNKIDSDGEVVIGAKLQVVDEEGNIVDSWTTDGNIHYVKGLEEGKTYILQEVKVPDPYVKAADVEFTVPSDKTNLEVEMVDKKVAILKTDVEGNPIEGAELYITDEEGNILDEWTSTLEEHYIKGLEEGKTYKIYEKVAPDKYVLIAEREFKVTEDKTTQIVKIADEQVKVNKTDVDGNLIEGAKLQVIDKEGNVIDEWVTDGTTHIVSGLKENETYILREVEVPEGYVRAADVEFTVPNNETNLEIELIDKVVEMTKVDIDGNELEGAKMQVFDKDNNLVDEWVSSKEPHRINGLVENETYRLHEEIAVDGYVKATDIEFTVTSDKENQKIEMIDKIVEVSKLDIAGEEIEGAKLQVIDEEGNIVDEWISKKEPHKVNGLTEGKTYILHEEIAVEGYVKAMDIEFTVSEEKENQKVEMIDKIIEVTKTDLTTGEELEGAELVVTDEEGNEIDKWVSGKEPHHVKGLEEGKTYTLTEKATPYGYEIAESIEFTVTSDKETQAIEMKDMPILTDVRLVKIDSLTKEVIKDNFTFGIYEDENATKLIKEVESDKENGTVIFDDLKYGIFYLKELKAPNEYILSDEIIKIEINDKGVFVNGDAIDASEDGVYSFEFENVKNETPNTGNNSNMTLWIALVAMSAISLIGIGVHEYKKKKSLNK